MGYQLYRNGTHIDTNTDTTARKNQYVKILHVIHMDMISDTIVMIKMRSVEHVIHAIIRNVHTVRIQTVLTVVTTDIVHHVYSKKDASQKNHAPITVRVLVMIDADVIMDIPVNGVKRWKN